jgi:protein SCO1/2
MTGRRVFLAAAWTVALTVACRNDPPPRQFELVGQVVAISPSTSEITVKHEAVKGFMPGMTMPFKVKDPALLTERVPGDRITATLVVGVVEAYLSTITKTGFEALTEAPPPPAPKSAQVGDFVIDAPFRDQAGTERQLADWRGHRVAVTFVYTRCPIPEFCPLMDRHFVAVQRELKTSKDLSDVRLVTITFDPAFDTPTVLAAHARALGADLALWSFLTPDAGRAAPFFEQFGLIVEREGDAPGDITHNLRTLVLDANGRITAIRTGNEWTPAQLLADLRQPPASAN